MMATASLGAGQGECEGWWLVKSLWNMPVQVSLGVLSREPPHTSPVIGPGPLYIIGPPCPRGILGLLGAHTPESLGNAVAISQAN